MPFPSPSQALGPVTKIEDIEVLRGLSILLVLAEHAPNLLGSRGAVTTFLGTPFDGGVGVDLFFTISGFVIARSLYPRLLAAKGRAESFLIAVVFWLRRAWRLLPAAWLWLVLPVAAAALFNQSGAFGTVEANLKAAFAGFFYYANAHFIVAWGVPELRSAVFPYWSLSLEEQFYLLLPLALILLRRRFVPVAVAIVAYCLASPDHGVFPATFRPEGLLIGVLIAVWAGNRSFASAQAVAQRYDAPLRPVVCALFLGLPFAHLWGGQAYTHVCIAPVCGLLVWIAAGDRNWFLPKTGSSHILLWLGARSYSLYLVHVPVYYAAREAWHHLAPSGGPTIPVLLSGLVATILAAEATFRLVEVPFRRHGRRIARRYEVKRGGSPICQ